MAIKRGEVLTQIGEVEKSINGAEKMVCGDEPGFVGTLTDCPMWAGPFWPSLCENAVFGRDFASVWVEMAKT